ncbi:MAG: acetate--CoA ligase [Candidatus Competibacteraceae bacterium]|nr:acetate--CoA ligase [Candidatus Competibacteraceae bacterium]MBK7983445.1 acetate--CoA ligase [Candidatus Competibacteraceae bacterium]MBK8898015.1 acetate--CoA ligase [Candidatus Competibacteraceae bacterium]MBK9951033.1 acetate--CoA ligase [Candidatus Competibacteraceae bacterium]
MIGTTIGKLIESGEPKPQLADYAPARADFSWAAARAELAGLPDGGLNIAWEAVDRQVQVGRGDATALIWLGKNGERQTISYAELSRLSNRFANLLDRLGVCKGDRICALAGRIPELFVTALGTLKAGAVFCPLFSAFGPDPIRVRLRKSQARVLVTTAALYERKVRALRGDLPALERVLLTDGIGNEAGADSLQALLAVEAEQRPPPRTLPEDRALLHFTSGTTGAPKGAIHVHDAIVAHRLTGRLALDLRPGDVYWCTADPGWVTGVSYGIIAPLANGATLVVDEAEFDARRWYGILERERVNVWYTAPTAIRMLMKAGVEAVRGHDLSALRFAASVGEPLNPEGVLWGQAVLGQPFHDTWWQTETGAIMIANYRSQNVRPGSMGRPLPGIEAAIVRRRLDGGVDRLGPGEEGELALRAGWPSLFRGYLNDEDRYQACFADGWYLSGDLATRDAEGYFWFLGRSDDVIKTAGHLIGPFEVESALLEHPAVAEAGMIGKPDAVAGEIIKAFVALKPDHAPSDALRKELIGFARIRLGPTVAPRELEFMADLPKTRSGKIMRRLLRARELGLPEGDLSTLESGGTEEN